MAESMHEKMMRKHGGSEDGTPPRLLSYEATLKNKQEIATGTYQFTFTKPANFAFTSGQHIRMTLVNPPETDDEGDSRFLSIASTPADKDLVFAMRMRDTAFKRTLKNMAVGEKVLLQVREHAHTGGFVLPQDTSRPVVFLVGGIGIVPAYSMIKDALSRKLPYQITMLYSNRTPADAPFLTELTELATTHANFTFVPTMTQTAAKTESLGDSWQGETGYIDRPMLQKYAVPNLQNAVFYTAGLSELVSAMQSLIKKLGVPEGDIHAEEYTGFTMAHGGAAMSGAKRGKWVALGIPGLVAIMVIGHMVLAGSLFSSLKTSGTGTKPWLYLLAGFTLGLLVALKLKYVAKFKHGKRT